jgi:class 3 adenylate cyclase
VSEFSCYVRRIYFDSKELITILAWKLWWIDCYVCATGLPQPQADHFIRMCHFARATVHKVSRLTKALEDQLGPGTGDLGMRVGIHSGSVTAGVLRGQKARFQLFGGTHVVL